MSQNTDWRDKVDAERNTNEPEWMKSHEWKCEVCGITVPAHFVHEHIYPQNPSTFYWIDTTP